MISSVNSLGKLWWHSGKCCLMSRLVCCTFVISQIPVKCHTRSKDRYQRHLSAPWVKLGSWSSYLDAFCFPAFVFPQLQTFLRAAVVPASPVPMLMALSEQRGELLAWWVRSKWEMVILHKTRCATSHSHPCVNKVAPEDLVPLLGTGWWALGIFGQ